MSDVVERRRLLMAGQLPVPTVGRVEEVMDRTPAWSVLDGPGVASSRLPCGWAIWS
ncbi:hypothetical protein ACWIF8_01620 [Micromonospora chalcea]